MNNEIRFNILKECNQLKKIKEILEKNNNFDISQINKEELLKELKFIENFNLSLAMESLDAPPGVCPKCGKKL